MHKLTHLDISLAIRRVVQKETGMKLDKLGFMYGNIKPDLSLRLINIPHFKHKSLDFVTSEIKKLLKYKIGRHTGCTREFSERLGIITHYLSDFFCHVHSGDYKGNVVAHYIYEIKLHLFCRRNAGILESFKYARYPNPVANCESICDSIEKLYKKYSMKKPSFVRDLTYALRMCTSIALLIITACMAQTMEPAA